jgi:hypothetical protein
MGPASPAALSSPAEPSPPELPPLEPEVLPPLLEPEPEPDPPLELDELASPPPELPLLELVLLAVPLLPPEASPCGCPAEIAGASV